MAPLDAILDVLGRRLTWLGISFRAISVDEAARSVPILDRPRSLPASRGPVGLPRSRSRHLLLEALPATLLLSLYEVRGSDHRERGAQVLRLQAALRGLVPPSLVTYTWTHAFLDEGVDVYGVLFGLEVPVADRVADHARALSGLDTVELLAFALRAGGGLLDETEAGDAAEAAAGRDPG